MKVPDSSSSNDLSFSPHHSAYYSACCIFSLHLLPKHQQGKGKGDAQTKGIQSESDADVQNSAHVASV